MKKQTVFYCLFLSIGCAYGAAATQQIPDVSINKRRGADFTASGAIKHTLSQQLISSSGAATVADVLKSSGEIQFHDASSNGTQPSISMRGFGANADSNTLILLNGIPLTNPDIAPPDLNTLPLASISEIEITAGSESVLYGDEAVGGVINIITDHSKEKLLRFQCDTGSYNLRECNMRLVNYYRALNYQLSFMAKSTDNYRDHNHYINDTLLGTAIYKADLAEATLDYKFTHENMQYPGALTHAQVVQNRQQSNNDTDFFADQNQYLHLNIKRPLVNNWKIKTDAFVSGMRGDGVLFAPFSQSRRTAYLKPEFSLESDKYNVITGFDLRVDKYHLGSAFGLTDNSQKQGGLYALLNQSLAKNLSLALGARGAAQGTHLVTSINAYALNRAFASTLGVIYRVSDPVSIYLRRAGNFRFPKAEESTSGQQPLRTQRGYAYEGGVRYETADKIVHLSLYQLNLRDEISFDPLQTPQNPFGSNQNLAPTVRTGTSLSANYPINKKLDVDAQLNIVHARFQSGIYAENRIPLVADLIARGGFLYRLQEHWQFYAEGIFTGNEYSANDNANVNGIQGGYMIYNINLRFKYREFSAALHVNNIFNKYYYLYTVYQPGINTEFFYPAPDRNLMLTASYSFT